jgi:hypothetical protein
MAAVTALTEQLGTTPLIGCRAPRRFPLRWKVARVATMCNTKALMCLIPTRGTSCSGALRTSAARFAVPTRSRRVGHPAV